MLCAYCQLAGPGRVPVRKGFQAQGGGFRRGQAAVSGWRFSALTRLCTLTSVCLHGFPAPSISVLGHCTRVKPLTWGLRRCWCMSPRGVQGASDEFHPTCLDLSQREQPGLHRWACQLGTCQLWATPSTRLPCAGGLSHPPLNPPPRLPWAPSTPSHPPLPQVCMCLDHACEAPPSSGSKIQPPLMGSAYDTDKP